MWGLSLKIWQLSPIKIAEGSIRISPKLKRDTVENGVPIVGRILLEPYKGDANWRK